MSAQLDVLSVGYAADRVAGTVVLVRDDDHVIVVDPGTVADRSRILGPLAPHLVVETDDDLAALLATLPAPGHGGLPRARPMHCTSGTTGVPKGVESGLLSPDDAAALVAVKFGIAAVLTRGFSLPDLLGDLVWVAGGGVAVGIGFSVAFGWIHGRALVCRDARPAPAGVLLLMLTPFAPYLIAEHFGFSGVMASVSAGMAASVLAVRHSRFDALHLQTEQGWNIVLFAFRGLIFTLVGLQLRPRRLREAAALWAALAERGGPAARDALWEHPDLLPSADDLDDPTGFVTGTSALPAEGTDFDWDAGLRGLDKDLDGTLDDDAAGGPEGEPPAPA